MNKLLLTAAIGLTASAVFLTSTPAHAASATIKLYSRFHIVTAAVSPDNSQCLQNMYDYTENLITGTGGYIDVSTRPTSPTTVYSPGVLRASELNYTTLPAFKLYDSAAPTGVFTNQGGTRFCWIYVAEDLTTPFLASDLYFASDSSDLSRVLAYSGNTGTNTAAPNNALFFSETLRGQVVGTNGVVITTYRSGETIAGHPVNRVIASVRVGFQVSDMTVVGNNLNYIKNRLLYFTNSFAVYAKDGSGNIVAANTNNITTHPHCRPEVQASVALGMAIVDIEGQRRLSGISYQLQRKEHLNSTNAWETISAPSPEGYFTDTNFTAHCFYRAVQVPVTSLASFSAPVDSKFVPSVQVYNGIE